MNTEQKDRQLLEIGRLHLALSKCAALELESIRVSEVQITYVDEDGDDNCAAISVETDDIAQLAGVKFRAHFSPTTIDPPEVIRFIRRNYPEVEIIPPKESIYAAAVRHGILPTMRIRWCCADFKEKYGVGKVVCSGVRKAESVKRSKRNEIEVLGRRFSGNIAEFEEYSRKRIAKKLKHLNQDQFADVKETEIRCISGKDKIMLNPIIEWSDSDVWMFLNDVVRVPHCELYDQGITRIGCIGCPMASPKNKRAAFKRWPYVREKWIQTIQAQLAQGGRSRRKNQPLCGRRLSLYRGSIH